MAFFSTKKVSMALLAGVVGLMFTGNATAGTTPSCETCKVVPATATTTTSSNSSSTSHVKIVIKKTVKAQIKQYEKIKHVVVAVNMRPNGVASYRGCVDPVRKGWINPGGKFVNTRKNGSAFGDRWQNGRRICGAHRARIGKTWWMIGTKDNCGNRGIRIQIAGPRKHIKVIKVVTFKTYKQFTSVYNKWVESTSSSTSTSTTSTSYSCAAGWTPINGGTQCQLCPPPCPPPPPPPPPPVNHPPTGDLLPPLHVYVSTDAAWGSAPVCVDNVSDPDGDPVTVSFSFSDQGKPPSAVFTQPGGARCVIYYAPKTVKQVTVTVTLSDDHGHSVTLLDNFPVIPDQFY